MDNVNEDSADDTESNYSESDYDSEEENAFWCNPLVTPYEGLAEIYLPSNFIATNNLLIMPQALLEIFYPFFKDAKVPIILLAFTVDQVLDVSICYLNKTLSKHQDWYQIKPSDPLAVILQITQFDQSIYKKKVLRSCAPFYKSLTAEHYFIT
jgi:hypothetical protein